MALRKARILILCKTYPSPSTKHSETSCVAGLEESGRMIRLYPVPFRLIEGEKFSKWQWLTAVVEEAKNDRRPESHLIKVDTIRINGRPIPTTNNWAARLSFIDRIPLFPDFASLESERRRNGATIGLVRPMRISALDIMPARTPDWTEEERSKLFQLQQQGNFFEANITDNIVPLRKLPFDFYYRYECEVNGKVFSYKHKIVDWEVGALYWNVRHKHGLNWESAFRAKLEWELPKCNLMLLMGNIHRFQDQWLIISLIYPPKKSDVQPRQQQLF